MFRYYPTFTIKQNLITRPGEFLVNGAPYNGLYYETFDGQYYSGANPAEGPNEKLTRLNTGDGSQTSAEYLQMQDSTSMQNATSYTQGDKLLYEGSPYTGAYYEDANGKYRTMDGKELELANPAEKAQKEANKFNTLANIEKRNSLGFTGQPTSYQPRPLDEDFLKGFFTRYFVKKINERGYVVEISEEEYAAINNGTVKYDVSYYQTTKLVWKLTGPLETQRLSQYDIRAGIIDTNKRNVENLNKTFIGIKTFIGDEYAKFAVPNK